MELNIQRQPIAACELTLAATAEHPIECDVLLPDYCPDIVRVLNCQVTGAVTDASVQSGSLMVDGMATVTLCYLGEIGGVRRTEYRLPFSKTFDLPSHPGNPAHTVTAEQGYLNCRAVSKRRLDIRGTLMISARVYDTSEQQAVSGADGCGVQLRTCSTEGARMGEQTLRQFSVREELSPALGRQPAAELVRADCRPVVQECRVVAGRAVLKGELLIHLLYKTDLETGALETADYTLPLSQLLELDGVEDDARCEAGLTCASVECAVDEDGDAGEGRIRVEAQMVASLRFFHPVELTGAVDSFSTLYVTDAQARRLRIPKLLSAVGERATVRAQAPLPDGTESIIDVWATTAKAASGFEAGRLSALCQVTFTALCQTADSGVECFTHTCDAVVPLPVAGADEQSELNPRFTVLSASGAVGGGGAQLTCELLVTGMVLGFETRDIITELTVDEANPKATDPAVGLIIYYARAGESVWDIAKRYGALPAQIAGDNALTEETLTGDTALIIPTA